MFFERDPASPERDRRAASIAVVPSEGAPQDRRQSRIAMGFMEDVIAELSRVPDFEVLAPRTSLSLPPEALQPQHMASAFGVTHLLDSSVHGAGASLQVKARLIEAATGRVSWSHSYDAPMRNAPAVLADIAMHVANALSVRVRRTRLADTRSRPLTSLAAQDCWLRGLDHLRRMTTEDDEAARRLFERALSVDPTYARGYAGLSVSHFKRWNWRRATEQEAADDRLARQYAAKAVELDDLDPVAQIVLGRTLVYGRDPARGRRALERAMALSPNFADGLMQAAPLWTYLGEHDRALALVEKAFRLNPLHEDWYYQVAIVPLFASRQLESALRILEQAPPHSVFEQSALTAACLARLGQPERARVQAAEFLQEMQRTLLAGRRADAGEAVAWVLDAMPFQPEDRAYLLDGLRLAGLEAPEARSVRGTSSVDSGRFVRNGPFREVAYAGRAAQLPDSKGCRDLALLMASPGERLHCAEIAGRIAGGDSGPALDLRARAECQKRIRDLQEELAEAERHNDYARAERLAEDLDKLIEQLSAAMGLRGRSRKLGDPAEKARTAVTWRIRSAIAKIAEAHPELGRHLKASVRTGAFCSYEPETTVRWTIT